MSKLSPASWSDESLTIAWLGHASFVLNFFGTKIVIDPALSTRIGITPLGNKTIGPSRYLPSPLRAEDIGPVDIVMISHAHTDHFDYPTLRQLQSKETACVTAKNTKHLWSAMDFKSITELHWQDSLSLSGINIKAIEGKHWGARLPWNKEMSANSFLISKNGVNIFFGGDTGYTDLIRQQLIGTSIDLAIIGIAAYSPKSFENSHATPEQAWRITEEISAKWIIPMHWGTFKLSREPMDEPISRFRQAAAGQMEKLAIQEIGGAWALPN